MLQLRLIAAARQHLSLSDVIGRGDDPLRFHSFDNPCGAVIPDLQMALLTLPEMVIWWLAIPLLALGAWFTIKHRIREIAPILIFTSLLMLTYSIVQGNVGTAYRQRAQLLVFFFIFVAVGFVVVKEKRAARRHQPQADRQPANRPRRRPDRGKDQVPAVG